MCHGLVKGYDSADAENLTKLKYRHVQGYKGYTGYGDQVITLYNLILGGMFAC